MRFEQFPLRTGLRQDCTAQLGTCDVMEAIDIHGRHSTRSNPYRSPTCFHCETAYRFFPVGSLGLAHRDNILPRYSFCGVSIIR